MHWGRVAAGPVHHPSVDGFPHGAVLLGVRFVGEEQQCLVLPENVDFLHAAVDFFAGLEEETLGAGDENLLTQLVLALVILGIEDVAKFVLPQDGHSHFLDETLVDIHEVRRCMLVCHKPFLTCLALLTVGIYEGLFSFK